MVVGIFLTNVKPVKVLSTNLSSLKSWSSEMHFQNYCVS